MKPVYKTILILLVSSIAMGFMESAVVVYLRALYYPAGFIFPLVPLDNHIFLTELLREAATLIMLITIAIVSGKNGTQKFVFFLFCFAVWDIFYYIFLWLLIGWPSTLLDWDILFLLPVPWIGPVLAPCLLSLTMILYTVSVVWLQEKGHRVTFRLAEWLLMIAGSLIVICSFTSGYFSIILSEQSGAPSQSMMERLINFIPSTYNWFVFMAGEALLVLVLVILLKRFNKQH
ncbi:MAG: hypothetical protein AB9834_00960 [Lentimicrobium sp.]